tara:strand:+ start:910 stop:1245 length:336 start_codon:yes stop_codon:yes gene_type:complete
MSSLILILHLAVAIILVGVILLQRSEGGALGIGGGGSGGGLSGFLKGRGQASGLVKITILLGTIFFITSMSLTIINSYNNQSIIDRVTSELDPSSLISTSDNNEVSVPILE